VSIVLYKLKTSNRRVSNRLSHKPLPNYNSALTTQSSKGILIRFHHLVTYISVFPSITFSPQFECCIENTNIFQFHRDVRLFLVSLQTFPSWFVNWCLRKYARTLVLEEICVRFHKCWVEKLQKPDSMDIRILLESLYNCELFSSYDYYHL